MDDEISIPVSIPLDGDGFLRRECPTCEQEFKWFPTPEGVESESVDQYFCPRCGRPAALDQWWTPAQIEYSQAMAQPEIDEMIDSALGDVFKELNRSKFLTVKKTGSFRSDFDAPVPLTDPDDMVIVVPPCHPNEPLKVPEEATSRIHCLICGELFAV